MPFFAHLHCHPREQVQIVNASPVFRRQKPLTSISCLRAPVCSASAHVINPVRRNPERKNLVVGLLFRFAFNVPPMQFSVSMPTPQKRPSIGGFPVEATLWHLRWDIYGTFCIDTDATAMLEALRKINEDWAKHDASQGHGRPPDVCFFTLSFLEPLATRLL